jgi:hypothetical protein
MAHSKSAATLSMFAAMPPTVAVATDDIVPKIIMSIITVKKIALLHAVMYPISAFMFYPSI